MKTKNQAGYTAISCGRVGRGGNTHFPTFQLERDGPTERPTDQPTDGRTKPLIELRVRNLKERKNSRKSVRWSLVSGNRALLSRLCLKLKGEQGSGPEVVEVL